MSNNLQIFENTEFGQLGVLLRNLKNGYLKRTNLHNRYQTFVTASDVDYISKKLKEWQV